MVICIIKEKIMSWNNVIPAELLLGVVKLEPKIVENPEVSIPEALVQAINILKSGVQNDL
jgi:hypothetical protein